jgi:DNA repair protein RadD
MTQLRDYQLDDVAKLRDAFRQHRRVLYCLPTGGGKTVVFAWISEAVAAKGKRVLILEHRRELVAQASAKLTDAGVPHGIIDAGLQGVSRHPVNVASVMTLRRRLDHYRDFPPDLVVVDEAHHAVAGSWDEILATFPLARILGVTATPERLDGKGLMTHFDTLVLGPTVRELIEAGYLANYIAYRRPGRALDLSGVRTIGGDYDQRQLSKLMSNAKLVGDALEHYGRHAGGKPAIAFCCTVDHAEAVAETFRAEGLRAYSVDGTMGGDERAARIGGLADGRTEVLTSCMLVSEGLDIPGVGAAILLRPTQSLALYLQQVGRTLRPKKDGGDAILLDHAGLMDRHGMPCDERGWR